MENTLKQVEASFRGLKSCGLVLLLRTKLGERKAGLQDRHPLVLLLRATTNGFFFFFFSSRTLHSAKLSMRSITACKAILKNSRTLHSTKLSMRS